MPEALQEKSFDLDRRHVLAGAIGALTIPASAPAFARGIEAPATEADIRFMRMALEEAALGDYPFGTVIVKDGEVLRADAISASSSRTPPRMARWSRSGTSLRRTAPRN
jgi:tRNA(adenine34) deaminase